MWEWLKQRQENAAPVTRAAPLQPPVMWLLGKTQAGKSSIVRALTDDPRATIGDLFQPCTRTAAFYDFPDADTPLLRFLDTRGLGEANYDPTEDLAQFAQQSQLLMVVARVMDLAQDPVLSALAQIRRQQPHWPLLVVFTSLHEGYPPNTDHLQPYPYDPWPLTVPVPSELAAALAEQRQRFSRFNAEFVAIDFTPPEEGFTPPDYGLPTLIDAIERLLPTAGLAIQTTHRDQVAQTILRHALMAGVAGAVPVPAVDLPVVVGIQTHMARDLAKHYDQPFDRQTLTELAGVVGMGLLAQLARRQLLKLIPAYGTAMSALLTAASTYALGQVLATYFRTIKAGGVPNLQNLQNQYGDQFKSAQNLLSHYFQRKR